VARSELKMAGNSAVAPGSAEVRVTYARVTAIEKRIRVIMDGLIAREWETSILQMLKRRGAKLAVEEVAGKFDGYTEAWITESFAVNSLIELMQKVADDE